MLRTPSNVSLYHFVPLFYFSPVDNALTLCRSFSPPRRKSGQATLPGSKVFRQRVYVLNYSEDVPENPFSFLLFYFLGIPNSPGKPNKDNESRRAGRKADSKPPLQRPQTRSSIIEKYTTMRLRGPPTSHDGYDRQ